MRFGEASGRGVVGRGTCLEEFLGDVAGDLERLLDRPPLGYKALDVVARGEVNAFGELLNVERDDVFHALIVANQHKKVPATKSGQDSRYPKKGGWHLFPPGGNGSIGGLVTVQSGGVLSPGNSPGLLSAGVLDLLAGSTSLMQMVGDGSGGAGTAGTDYDSLTISTSGGLWYGGSLDLLFGNGTAFLDDTFFDLFAFRGSPAGHFDSVFTSGTGPYGGASLSGMGGIWTTVIGEQRLTFSELTGRLSFTAVPEIDPATGGSVLSLVTGMLALLEQRRRRRTSPTA